MATSPNNLLFLNHYKNKSQEEWELKVKTVNNYGYMKGKWIDRPFEYYDKNANQNEDLRIQRFVPELKKLMKHTKPPKKNKDNKPFFLVLVCMFREEDLYLKEFLNYYILQGVDHFYLYDNENPESTMKILEPYIKYNYITLINWPDKILDDIPENERRSKWNDYKNLSTQNLAFEHFTKNFKDSYTWVIKCDIDEFIYPAEKYNSIKHVIKKKFDKNTIKGITIPRRNFGSGGHIEKPKGLVIENFTRCEESTDNSKSIGNNKFIKLPSYGAHSFDYEMYIV